MFGSDTTKPEKKSFQFLPPKPGTLPPTSVFGKRTSRSTSPAAFAATETTARALNPFSSDVPTVPTTTSGSSVFSVGGSDSAVSLNPFHNSQSQPTQPTLAVPKPTKPPLLAPGNPFSKSTPVITPISPPADLRHSMSRKRTAQGADTVRPSKSRSSDYDDPSQHPDRAAFDQQLKAGLATTSKAAQAGMDARDIIKAKRGGLLKTPDPSSESEGGDDEVGSDVDFGQEAEQGGSDSSEADIGAPVLVRRNSNVSTGNRTSSADYHPPTPPLPSESDEGEIVEVPVTKAKKKSSSKGLGARFGRNEQVVKGLNPFLNEANKVRLTNSTVAPPGGPTVGSVASSALGSLLKHKSRPVGTAPEKNPFAAPSGPFAGPPRVAIGPRLPVMLAPRPPPILTQELPLGNLACDAQHGLPDDQCRILLEERDRALRDQMLRQNTRQDGSVGIRGECPDMCPEQERFFRIFSDQLSVYEKGSDNRVDHDKCIKDFQRGAADANITLPHEVRPLGVLRYTVEYLCANLMSSNSPTNDYYPIEPSRQRTAHIADWYSFIWSRLRAIRKDITQMRMQHRRQAIEIFQICARFHIYCSYAFCQEPHQVFDPKLNQENLDKCLTSLKQTRTGFNAEFIAIAILMNFDSPQEIAYALTFATTRDLQDRHIRRARKAYAAFSQKRPEAFFRLLETSDPISACILHRYVEQMRAQSMNNLKDSTGRSGALSQIPLLKIQKKLRLYSNDRLNQYIIDCGYTPLQNPDTGLYYVENDGDIYRDPMVRATKVHREIFIDQIGEVVDVDGGILSLGKVGMENYLISNIIHPLYDVTSFRLKSASTAFDVDGNIGEVERIPSGPSLSIESGSEDPLDGKLSFTPTGYTSPHRVEPTRINADAFIQENREALYQTLLYPAMDPLLPLIADCRLKVKVQQALVTAKSELFTNHIVSLMVEEIVSEAANASKSQKVSNYRTDNVRLTTDKATRKLVSAAVTVETRRLCEERLTLARRKQVSKVSWNLSKEFITAAVRSASVEICEQKLEDAKQIRTADLSACCKKIEGLKMRRIFDLWKSRIALRNKRRQNLLTSPPKRSKVDRMGVVKGQNSMLMARARRKSRVSTGGAVHANHIQELATPIVALQNPAFNPTSDFFKSLWPLLRQVRNHPDRVKTYVIFCDFKGELALPLNTFREKGWPTSSNVRQAQTVRFTQLLPSDLANSAKLETEVSMICLASDDNFDTVVSLLQGHGVDLTTVPFLIKTGNPATDFSLKYHIRTSSNLKEKTGGSGHFSQKELEWAMRIAHPLRSDNVKLNVAEMLNHLLGSSTTMSCGSVLRSLAEYTDIKLIQALSSYQIDSLLDDDSSWQTEIGFKKYLVKIQVSDVRAKIRFQRMLERIKQKIAHEKNGGVFGLARLFGVEDMDTSTDTHEPLQLKAGFMDFKPLFRLILEHKLQAVLDRQVIAKRDFFTHIRKRRLNFSGRSRSTSTSKAMKRSGSPVRALGEGMQSGHLDTYASPARRASMIEVGASGDTPVEEDDFIVQAKRRLAEISNRTIAVQEKMLKTDRFLKSAIDKNIEDRSTLDGLLPDIRNLFAC